ncbi:MAG: hypothetical protein PWP14_558 [Methanolobus sp.]|nr:hypothetical protein [Methanolobus sp.]
MRIKKDIMIGFVIALLLMTVGTAAAQAPAEEWNKTFGGAYNDGAFSVQQLSDGGYIIAGYYYQDSTYDSSDAWLIKNYANGTEEWNKTFGGSLYDCAESVQQTSDGGYILAGFTRSFGAVETDALLIKTDASGTEEWNRTFGGVAYDGFKSVQQTFNTTGDPDGYIIAGYVDNDAMLIKIYANGTEEWNKKFDSGSLSERAESVQQTADGGYILAGHTGSPNSDFWLIKTYADGTEEWNKRFDSGVFDNDYAYSVQQTSDGGYILAGSTGSYDSDFWLIKTYADGTEEWNKKFDSGSLFDCAESVQQTSDGGYILAGRTYSITNSNDAWLIKTYADGTEEWNMTFGGTGNDEALSVQQTSDSGYIIAGRTAANGSDAWLIKIAETAIAVKAPAEEWNNTFDIGLHDYAWSVQQTSPDGGYILAGFTGSDNFDALLIKTDYNGNEMWNKTLDNASWDYAESVQQTSDGGYILAGTTLSDQGFDAWLIKTNEMGVEQWNNTFGGTGSDQASSVQQTSDGGYILAGYTGVVDTGVKDAWLIKTNETGVEEWNNTFGDINDDRALSVQQTSDGGYILAGSKSTLAEDSDAWLIKTDKNGTLEWDMTFAGTTSNSEEEARSVQQTSDGGYILAGYTGPNGLPDAWLIKTNETGVEEWNKTFGGTGYDGAYSVQQTSDGGYILAGTTTIDNVELSGWLIKTDSAGIEEWNIKLNDGGATSVRQTLDGGYILAGIKGSQDSSDALLVKIAGTSTVGTDIIINDTTPYTIGVGDALTIGVGDTLTIENGGTLTIEEGGTLTIEDGRYIDNGGRINNYGTIDNSGQIDNNNKDGVIYHDNGGTIDNYGEIYNNEGGTIDNDGWIDNYGTIENDGIIDNSGVIYHDNDGTIDNYGEIYNNEGGTIDNYGELDNYGTINNKGFLYCDVGTIYNNEGGTIDNYGTIYNDYGTIENYGEIYNNEGSTLKNYGTIENYGDSIHNYGTIANAGTIDNYGTFANYAGGTIENAGIINIFSGTLTGEGSISGEGSINDYTTVELVADAGGPYNAVEGSEITFDASKSSDLDGDALQYRWDFESNGTWTAWSTEPTSTYTWNDDWEGMATVEVSDGKLNNTSTAAVTVTNADPVVGTIVSPIDPCQVNTLVSVSGTFSDPGTEDTHTAVWNWGDGTTSVGTVSETDGAGTVTGEHTYVSPGVYWVNVTVTDDDGSSTSRASEQYVVVYDPSGGFVTGAGWIYSPAGAYTDAPSIEGKATFGFVSKYEKKAAALTGNTEFEFKIADLKFKSTSYDWLVIAGSQAKYKGSGTINGAGDYGFMLSAVDGAVKGDSVDKFRIKIWDKASGEIVYDNEVGVSEDEEPSTAIGGGSIVIRKAK